ncbi:toluene tolerance protein [Pseudomonas sp. MMS21-TM103]|uniref:lipopolysaccharide kinase InaA family protein n=1 Tax=Pseudomonas sp. MMS21 TM103 TaxID=2886506 RepID=UPI001EDFE3F5|nr:lipopolysaccharide kinase InaA family protein [Pseudomonas sp. MMS21 TM103]MCG4452267.1 toluene tolerance protein [Pseudomonas sp. MMS21 TM103]
MRIVTAQELESWLTSGKVLEKDARGPKVLALPDGHFLKIFHTRRHPLLARLRPAAKHFARNAHLLNALGIATPTVTETFWLDPKSGLSGCLYRPLPGTSLESLYTASPEAFNDLLPRLAIFIRTLHRKKIYFRSLHLGNILLLPDDSFGLIDFLDLKRNVLPLSAWHTKRNLKHLESYLNRKNLTNFPLKKLLKLYKIYS